MPMRITPATAPASESWCLDGTRARIKDSLVMRSADDYRRLKPVLACSFAVTVNNLIPCQVHGLLDKDAGLLERSGRLDPGARHG